MDGVDLHGKRWCYYVPEDQDPKVHGGYVPAVVVADEPGYYPCTGDPKKLQAPWVWGKSLTQAEKIAREMNLKHGVSEEEALLIVASSMRASNAGREVR